MSSAARRSRVLSLLRRFGWNPSSFQVLDPGYRYWFTRDAVVAYFDTGRALVVAGAPVCQRERLREVAQRFAAAGWRRNRRVSFFGVHERLLSAVEWPRLPIGEVPHWDPRDWKATLVASRSLRDQLRRARSHGVSVERPVALGSLGVELVAVRQRWAAARRLAPMSFLVGSPRLEARRGVWVARRGTAIVGYACVVPIYGRAGVLIQDLIRAPDAPNGTTELLVDAVLSAAGEASLRYATLGLAPLAGALPLWLRVARRLGTPLFDFEGLRAFKAKLRPKGWEQASLIAAVGGLEVAVLDALNAFAGGNLVGFAAATLRRQLRAA